MKSHYAAFLFLSGFIMMSTGMKTTSALPLFDARKNITARTYITWEQARDVEGRCNEESRRRGFNGFKVPLEACSFWGKVQDTDVCHIITENKLTHDTLGHEVRHCFQGDFHK